MSKYTELQARINQLMNVLAVRDGDEDGRVGTPVNFTGALSVGTIAEYVWDFGDGNRATGVTVQNTYQATGTYTVTLRVTSTTGGMSTEQSPITINAALVPLTADAGPDLPDAVEGVAVTLDGSGSTGDNLDTSLTSWDPGDGTTPYIGSLIVQHTYQDNTNSPFTATLTIYDGLGGSDADDATVTVADAGGVPLPVMNANGPYVGEVGVPIQFTAQGSSVPGPEYTLADYEWDFGDGATSGQWAPSHTYDSDSGSPYTVRLTGWNSEGASAYDETTATITTGGTQIPDWMDDGITSGPWTINIDSGLPSGFPRISIGSLKDTSLGVGGTTAQQRLACFDGGSQKPFNNTQPLWVAAQAIAAASTDANGEANVLLYGRRVAPSEYQGPANSSIGDGPQFFQTAASTFAGDESGTPDGDVFAGHWLYQPYHTLAVAMTNTVMQVTVSSRDYLVSNHWHVIYDGNFNNAEFVRLGTVASNTISILERAGPSGKSTAVSHGVGSRIAALCLAQSQLAGSQLWSRNMATSCPQDAAGNTLWEAMSEWVARNYHRYGTTIAEVPTTIYEVTADSDWLIYADRGSLDPLRRASCANRPASEGPDYGFYNGENVYGDGMTAYYNNVVNRIVALEGAANRKSFAGGDCKTYVSLGAGDELEAALDGTYGITSNPNWNLVQGKFSIVRINSDKTVGPCTNFPFCKSPPSRWSWFPHLQTAAGLVCGGMSSFINADDPWPWQDFYAVIRGGANHGDCVSVTNYAGILANKHWMGTPLGRYERIINPADFALGQQINGTNYDFQTDDSGSWSTSGATIAHDLTYGYTANGRSMRLTPTNVSPTSTAAANATSPSFSMSSGQDYTICFVLRQTAAYRRVSIVCGAFDSGPLIIPAGETKFVYSWRQTSNTNTGVRFEFSQGYTPIWVDQLLVFNAYSGCIKREFQYGLAVVKLDYGTARSNVPLGGTWQRPNGSYAVDDGQQYTTVSFDTNVGGALYIRPL